MTAQARGDSASPTGTGRPGHDATGRDHRRAGADLHRAPAGVAPAGRPGRRVAGRRGDLQLADHPAAAGLAQPRPGLQDLRRRRQRVRRPARRLRRRAGRATATRPSSRRSARRSRCGTHFAQPTRTAIAVARGTVAPVRPAAVAVRQLRHRGHDGRGAPDARHHRPRPDHQGRGLLPRPPRLGAGLGLPGGRRPDRARGPARRRAVQHRHPAGDHRPDADRRLQRPGRGATALLEEHPRPGRRHDPRADHDERRDHQARARLPGRA